MSKLNISKTDDTPIRISELSQSSTGVLYLHIQHNTVAYSTSTLDNGTFTILYVQ